LELGPYTSDLELTALGKTAGMASQAPVFMNDLTAAIGTGTHYFFVIFKLGLSIIADYPTNSIRAGKDLVPVSPGWRGAAYTGNLFHNGRQAHP
jgi:hypothetical protein